MEHTKIPKLLGRYIYFYRENSVDFFRIGNLPPFSITEEIKSQEGFGYLLANRLEESFKQLFERDINSAT